MCVVNIVDEKRAVGERIKRESKSVRVNDREKTSGKVCTQSDRAKSKRMSVCARERERKQLQ